MLHNEEQLNHHEEIVIKLTVNGIKSFVKDIGNCLLKAKRKQRRLRRRRRRGGSENGVSN
jgi:hypothetical protein